jgi:hypothetical protein
MATRQFNTQLVASALGLMVQIGFLCHHVSIVAPILTRNWQAAGGVT